VCSTAPSTGFPLSRKTWLRLGFFFQRLSFLVKTTSLGQNYEFFFLIFRASCRVLYTCREQSTSTFLPLAVIGIKFNILESQPFPHNLAAQKNTVSPKKTSLTLQREENKKEADQEKKKKKKGEKSVIWW